MKSKSILLLLIGAVLSVTMLGLEGCRMRSRSSSEEKKPRGEVAPSDVAPDAKTAAAPLVDANAEGADLPEKEEIRRSYALKPGARVSVSSINGSVRVETADIAVADVLIVRSAKTKEDLQYRQISIERNNDGLSIYVESDRKSIFSAIGSIPEGRQRVLLRLPKKVDFEGNGINGDLAITGEILGRAEVRGVTGNVKAARINGETDIIGINGSVDVTFAPLTGKSVEVRGINGNVEMRFEGEVNADLGGWGVNGKIDADLPNVENREAEARRGRVRYRIGTGGTRIDLSGINGNVHLVKAEKAPMTAASK